MSIQHDLETDKPLSVTGNLFYNRKSFWEQGVSNVSFVINELKKMKNDLDLNKIILMGHSDGSDIFMMFAKLYPEAVLKIISLDNRIYPFPER